MIAVLMAQIREVTRHDIDATREQACQDDAELGITREAIAGICDLEHHRLRAGAHRRGRRSIEKQ